MIAAYEEIVIENDNDFELRVKWNDASGNYVAISKDSGADCIFGISLRGDESNPLVLVQKSDGSSDGTVSFPGQGLIVVTLPKANIPSYQRAYYSLRVYYHSLWYRLCEGVVYFSTESAPIPA